MKFLIFFASALALASANIPPYYYGQHIPLINHNGVPVDTPEVQAAKALHFAAHAAASHGTPLVYTGHYGVPNVGADGRPLDTPEVQLAKAAHFIAYNQAAVRNTVGGHYGAVLSAAPLDTPEVQLAKAAHFAAHAEANARSGHYRKRRAAQYYGGYAQPQIGPNGVPLDTPEVAALKAQHYAAHNNVQHHQNALAPQDDHFEYHGQYGYHIPVIGPNGVPVEPAANQAEKAKHLAAYNGGGYQPQAQNYYNGAQSYNSGHYSGPYAGPPGPNGAPIDTPEVQAAKAAHLAAHARAG